MKNYPGSTARDLSLNLELSKNLVNSTLYKSNEFTRTSNYRWFHVDDAPETETTTKKNLDTFLSKISGYYGDIIDFDSYAGLSVFATSKYQLDYLEIDKLNFDHPEPFNFSRFQSWRNGIRDIDKKDMRETKAKSSKALINIM